MLSLLLAVALTQAPASSSDGKPVAPPPPPEPPTAPAGVTPSAQPPAPPPAPPSVSAKPAASVEEDFDVVRFRSGISLGGGVTVGPVLGPTAALSVRLGAQWGRYFGTYLQSQPTVFFVSSDAGVVVGFTVNNSLLAALTLFDMLELGVGPSLDYLGLAGCAGSSCIAGTGLAFGADARVAVNFGHRDPRGGRRSGLTLSADLHPLFVGDSVVFFTVFSVGVDWF